MFMGSITIPPIVMIQLKMGGISNNSNITFQMQSFSLDHERCTHLEELGKGPYDDSIRCSILSYSHMIPI